MKPYKYKNWCLQCTHGMTWAEIKVQYARLKKRGFTDAQTKTMLPRCQMCMTKHLKSLPKSEEGQ